jgi:hypothetical protein
MELAIYFLVYLLAIWFIFFPKFLTQSGFFITWFVTVFLLSLIIRSSIGDTKSADIDNYIYYMTAIPGLEISLNYMLREFIFWFGIRFLFFLVQDGSLVFVILDVILFLYIYKGFILCKKAFYPKLNQSHLNYLLFSVMLFHPFVMGMHNTYRQILATSIFITAIGLIGNKKTIKGYLTSLIAVFIHNASAMFLPLLMLVTPNKIIRNMSFFTIPPIVGLLILTGSSENEFISRDNSIDIGSTLQYLLAAVFIILFSAIAGLELTSKHKKGHDVLITFFLILILLFIPVVITSSGEQAQRLSFYVFSFIFPFLGFYVASSFKPRVISSLVFFHFSILPLFLIYNTTIDLGF